MLDDYEDRTLTCVDCKEPWIFGAGEQQFFAYKRLSQPKRCKLCRKKNKERRECEGQGGGRRGN